VPSFFFYVAARCCPPGPRAKFLSFSSVSRFAGQEKIFRSKIEQRVSLSVRILWELKRNWDQEEFGAHLSADLVETELKPQSGNAVGWDASACTTAILTGQRGSSHIETGAGILGKMPMEQNLGATIAGSCIHPATTTWPGVVLFLSRASGAIHAGRSAHRPTTTTVDGCVDRRFAYFIPC
jgi:hypothetical protein